MQEMSETLDLPTQNSYNVSSEADCEYPFGLAENSGKGVINS